MSVEEKLLAPQQALWNYLDALLREIPPSLPETDEIQDWDPAALEPAAPTVEAPPRPGVERPRIIRRQPVVAPAPRPVPEVPEPIAEQAVAPPPAEPPAALQPEWGQAEFQALLFSVGGLTLAVPLVTLNSVVPWPEHGVTPMPNQPAWCFGLLHYRERNVRVVDTGTLVIPPDREELRPTEPPEHILIVGDGSWGLACSAIGNVVRLAPDDVRWRRGGGRRPWLAGTVLGHLCALLDTDAFARMLADAGRAGARS